jgi:hypothetical protein
VALSSLRVCLEPAPRANAVVLKLFPFARKARSYGAQLLEPAPRANAVVLKLFPFARKARSYGAQLLEPAPRANAMTFKLFPFAADNCSCIICIPAIHGGHAGALLRRSVQGWGRPLRAP